jgi:hypothetical protein
VRTRLELINTRLRAHPKLPWNVWSMGLTSIKAQVSNWVGMSAATLAGPSVLAAAILLPAPAMVERADGYEASSPAVTVERVASAGFAVDTDPDDPVDRSGSPVHEPDDYIDDGSWFRRPVGAVLPSTAAQQTSGEPAATEAILRVATTSEPAPTSEMTSGVGYRDRVEGGVASSTDTLVAGQAPAAQGVSGTAAAGGSGSDRDQDNGRDAEDQGQEAHGGSPKGVATGQNGGHGNGNADDQANGNANGHGNGQANGNGNANGQANGNGNANGQANGNSNGNANGHANDNSNGNANGNGVGQANGHATGNANGQANGNSNGQANGNGQGAESTQAGGLGSDPVRAGGGAPSGQTKGQSGSDEKISKSRAVANGNAQQAGSDDEQDGQADADGVPVAQVEVTVP